MRNLQVVDVGVQLSCLLPRDVLLNSEDEGEEVVGQGGSCRGIVVGVVSRVWSIGIFRMLP